MVKKGIDDMDINIILRELIAFFNNLMYKITRLIYVGADSK